MELKKYLKLKNLTHREFAELLDVSPSAIGNYISGCRIPCLRIGKMIENITQGEVTIDDLISYWYKINKDKKNHPLNAEF